MTMRTSRALVCPEHRK